MIERLNSLLNIFDVGDLFIPGNEIQLVKINNEIKEMLKNFLK